MRHTVHPDGVGFAPHWAAPRRSRSLVVEERAPPQAGIRVWSELFLRTRAELIPDRQRRRELNRKRFNVRHAVLLALVLGVLWSTGRDGWAAPPETRKVCQLTGADDRDGLGRLTGAELTGITGGVTGTDIGFSFEFGQRLHFLFGDSREFGRDLCEPGLCGPADHPKPLNQPDTTFVQRWRSQGDWDKFSGPNLDTSPQQYAALDPAQRGDGWDSRASAPVDFDPDHCIPLSFDISRIGVVYSQAWDGGGIASPVQWSGPPVASNLQDRWVLAAGGRILVITADGSVFAHPTHGSAVDPARQMTGPKVAANPGDKWVLVADSRILVMTADGRVFAHALHGNTIDPAHRLSGPPVAANPQDRYVVYQDGRLFVITANGSVFAHVLSGDTVLPAQQLSAPPVAANPQDRWVLPFNGDLAVVTKSGSVFVHRVRGNTVESAFQMAGALIVAQPRIERVLVSAGSFLVLTGPDGRFTPTLLDGLPLARNEGAFSAFVDANGAYTFFTRRNRPVGCSNPLGCAHADQEPGGKLVMARSTDAGASYQSLSTVSVTRFLFGVPVVAPAAAVDGLPSDVSGQAVFLFGAGRRNNDQPSGAAPFNHSPPFLAVASADSRGVQDGRVFEHELSDTAVMPAIQLRAPIVAAQPQDKWTVVLDGRILVITSDGRVFSHAINGDTVQPAFQLAGANVAARAADKYLLAMGHRILVITSDGRVFAHDVNGDTVGIPFQLDSPKVAANTIDKYVLAMDNRIVVITSSGDVYAHTVNGNVVSAAVRTRRPSGRGPPRGSARPRHGPAAAGRYAERIGFRAPGERRHDRAGDSTRRPPCGIASGRPVVAGERPSDSRRHGSTAVALLCRPEGGRQTVMGRRRVDGAAPCTLRARAAWRLRRMPGLLLSALCGQLGQVGHALHMQPGS